MADPETETRGYSAAREALIEFDTRRKGREGHPVTAPVNVTQDALREFFDLLKNAEAQLRSWGQRNEEERLKIVRRYAAPTPPQVGVFRESRAYLERQRRLRLAGCLFMETRLVKGSRAVADAALTALFPTVE